MIKYIQEVLKEGLLKSTEPAPVAQLDRAMDFESRGRAFKSRQARQARQAICGGAGGEPPRVPGGRGIIS